MSSDDILSALKIEGIRFSATGEGSAGAYGLLSSGEKLSLYVPNLSAATKTLGVNETRVFPNIQLIETRGETEYFDTRVSEGGIWASPVQTWLELSSAGPREQEAAREIEKMLLESRGEYMR